VIGGKAGLADHRASGLPLSKRTAELLNELPREVAAERVINEKLAAEFLSLSYSYLRVLREEGRGPTWVRISDNRVGYRIRDLIAWCEARERRSARAAGAD
jgi:hypothetical protein